jgi:hypothetical protein
MIPSHYFWKMSTTENDDIDPKREVIQVLLATAALTVLIVFMLLAK